MEDSRGEEDTSCKAFGLMVARRGPLVCCCRAEWLSCALTSVLLPLSREATETRPCREQYRTNSDHVIKHGICLEASPGVKTTSILGAQSFLLQTMCLVTFITQWWPHCEQTTLKRKSSAGRLTRVPLPCHRSYVHAAVDQDLHLEILINAT